MNDDSFLYCAEHGDIEEYAELKYVPTADLVLELCSRDNVSFLRLNSGESCAEPRPRIQGPSLVIVVRGDIE